MNVEETLKSLTTLEKVQLLGGRDFWHFESIPDKGVPAIRTSDGPNGVRGQQFFNGKPASCFPCGTGLASSFDVQLVHAIGEALGQEARAKGAHVILGPTCNTARHPFGGRGFESYSEDPHLSGMMAAAYVNGVQSQKVAACIKHYAANDQEFDRFNSDSVVSERALREIYLEPFRLAQKLAKPLSFMTAYNRVNGVHASENEHLLVDILRKEWAFEGLVISDWTGVYSIAESIKAGMDVEMPGKPKMRGLSLMRTMASGKLSVADLDVCVARILRLVKYAQESGIPFDAAEDNIDTPELRALLRKAASSAIVLLKNEGNILPLTADRLPNKKLAVIGENAASAIVSGGGSAALLPTYKVSPLQGIQDAATKLGVAVEYGPGISAYRFLPLIDQSITTNSGKSGMDVSFWRGSDATLTLDWLSEFGITAETPAWETETASSLAFMIDGLPAHIASEGLFIRATATFKPSVSGSYSFSLVTMGPSMLFIDGKLVVDNTTNWQRGELFFQRGSTESIGDIDGLDANKAYALEVRVGPPASDAAAPFNGGGAIRIGAVVKTDEAKRLADATALAKSSDAVILVVGLNNDFESEGFDRKTLGLPGANDKLVVAVLAANPNTIVVNQSGMPVTMPWVADAPALLQAFYGGNELGSGLADVIFGATNPSGRLPLTFPRRVEDVPAHMSFGDMIETPGKVIYNEGIYVGYRHVEKYGHEPLFPFGFGLSYTTFEYSNLQLSHSETESDIATDIKLTVKNTGDREGSEVVQVYVKPKSPSLPRPIKELKGFSKLHLSKGSSAVASIALQKEAYSFWHPELNAWIAEAGDYEILIGSTAQAVSMSHVVTLKHSITWTGL